jgi:PST family polysaccharide transporter
MEVSNNNIKVYALVSFVVLAVTGYGMQIIVNHGFGVEGLGEFNSSLAYFLIASLVTTMGSNFGVLSFASNPKNKNLYSRIWILKKALKLSLIGFVIVFIITFFSVTLYKFDFLINNVSFILLSVGTLFFAVNKILLAFINALNQMPKYYLLQSTRYLLMFICTLFCVYVYQDIRGLSLIFLFSEIALMIILVSIHPKKIYWQNLIQSKQEVCDGGSRFITHCFKSLPAGVIQELAVRVDIIMLTLMSTTKSVGYYSIAAMIAEGLNQILVIWRDSFSPLFVKIINENTTKLKAFILRMLLQSGIALALLLTVTYLLYKSVIGFVFGPEIVNFSINTFGILAAGLILGSPFTMLQLLPNQMGKPEVMSIITVFTVLINVVCNYFFIPIWAGLGAAIATSLSWLVGSIGIIWWTNSFIIKTSSIRA